MTMNLDEMQMDSQAFWDQCEAEAEKLEITVDYYLMEFTNGFQLNTEEEQIQRDENVRPICN